MKREEFFTIMDCVSEEDAAEMMQYCRSEQLPDREEEIVMTKHTDHAESGGKRSKGIAAAVAAVLVCANVAGGAYLLRNSNTAPETGSNAGESIQTDAVEVVTASGQTETEPSITASEAVETPQYVKLMQEYFTKTGGEPCTFDFTGYGKDFDIEWENNDYKLTLRAVTGCEWALYYFYDVEPKKGQTWEQFVQDNPHFRMYISSESESPWESQYTMGWSTTEMMEQDKALDNGVWHFCTYLMPQPGVPLYMNYTSLYFTLEIQGCSEAVQPTEKVALDFFQYQHPMHELETPVRLADVCEGKIMTAAAGELMLTQRAETPFGVFYCGQDEFADKTNNFTEYACAKKDGETLADYVPSEQYQRTIGNDMIAVQSDQPSIAEPSNVGVQQQIQFMNLLFKSPVPLKNAQKSASEDMQGSKVIPSETTEYVQLMQDYYTKLNGQPCTYDFTGMGMDINASFEDDLYTLTHKAVVGCDWFLFYFYDITPKEHFFEQYNGNSIYSSVCAQKGDKKIDGFSSIGPGGLMPGLDPDVPEDGVFHCCVKYVNDAAVPFFHGENAGAELVFPNYATGEEFRVEFVPEEIPLQKKESPKVEIDPLLNLRDNEIRQKAERSLSLFRQRNTEHPLTRCADTPFGRIYYSDCFTPDSEYLYQNSMDPDRCTQDSTFLSYNGIDSSVTKDSFFGDLGPDILDPDKYRVFTLFLPYTVPGMIDAE